MNNDNLTYYIDLPRKRPTKAEKLADAKKRLARAKAEYADAQEEYVRVLWQSWIPRRRLLKPR